MKQFVLLSGAVLCAVALSPSNASADAFSDCTCVTEPGAFSGGVGQIIASDGEVLVNNAAATSGQGLLVNSEILVGAGAADISVGANCASSVGPNTIISITQPAGPAGNICVRMTSNEPVFPVEQPTTVAQGPGTLLVIGGIAGAAALLTTVGGDDDDDRKPASN